MAKILIASKEGAGAWFTLRLLEEGHSVDYYLNKKEFEVVLQGLVPEPMFNPPDFRKYDLVMFDVTGMPKLAEEAISMAPTIGDGDLHSELEDDRLLGIEVMEQTGINVPEYEHFNDINEAKRYIRKFKKRYVFKPFNPPGKEQDSASTYVSKDADDLLDYLDKLGTETKDAEFILQEVVKGTEISTEAYFNGEEFYLINATLEEKKFMDHGIGPNTGCSGNLVWAYDHSPAIFEHGLLKMKDFLKGVGFRGMIDLNTIASDSKIYGLEWTPRFGYDASATLFSLIRSNLGEFLGAVASGAVPNYQISNAFAAGVRISIPPYPTEVKGKHPFDIPIKGIEQDDVATNYYLYDCYLDGRGSLITAGVSGFITVPISTGDSIEQAFGRCYGRVEKIQIPDMQYRNDIEECCIKRYKTLQLQGWL